MKARKEQAPQTLPILFSEIENCVDEVIKKVGKTIRLAIPVGIGKPNQFVNALYARAVNDPEMVLTIFTALTLEKPKGNSLLEKRFMEPFAQRVFEDYPDLDYELARTKGQLPSNVRIIEFFFPAGKFVGNGPVQRDYVSTNYTHAARDLIDVDVNVIAQMVAKSKDGKRLSLSCNPDVTLDVMKSIKNKNALFVAQVNNNLPYMYGDADVPANKFNYIIDNPDYDFKIFGPPKMSVSDADYMIGLQASTLVKDDGEIQVGIGSLGDSLIYALLMRNKVNMKFRELINAFEINKKFNKVISSKGSLEPITTGLFGASEMFVDGFMHLVKNNILKKKVYDHLILQRLLNEGLINENKVTPESLYLLLSRGAIKAQLTKGDFDFLQKFGVLRNDLSYENGNIHFLDGTVVEADLNQDDSNQTIISKGLGKALQNGAIVHGGFFLGATDFYNWLREMPEEKRRLIHMKSVTSINQLYGHEELDRLHRKNARFFNTCLKMTLLGAAASDGLEDGNVVSGVGGQYNFVEMAHALPDGHSILQLRSTKYTGGKLFSNIVFNYGHITIPRHLRDIVITEYGIADIRGKTDQEVIKALIQIADSRFQEQLMDKAKASGKLSPDYEVPETFKNNFPEKISRQLAPLKKEGLFPAFPFGTDFTEEEQKIGKALKSLKKKTGKPISKFFTILKALTLLKIPGELQPYLKRMDLDQPINFEERLYQKLLARELMSL